MKTIKKLIHTAFKTSLLTCFLLMLILCWLPKASIANIKQNNIALNKAITQLLPDNAYSSQVGVSVRKTSSNSLLFEKNSHQLLSPASIQKLFIATAALIYLKPEFTFDTTLGYTGTIKNRTLNGDLYIHFSGDPYLTTQQLTALLNQIKKNKITSIKGTIFIDKSTFDSIPYPPGWLWGDLSYSFASPLSAIIIDENKFHFHFTPNKTLGQHPIVTNTLPNHIISKTNHIQTTSKYLKNCPLTIYSNAHNEYTLGGCLPSKWGKQQRSVALRNPDSLAMHLVKQSLKKNRVQYSDIQFTSHRPHSLQTLAIHHSQPLYKMMSDLLQHSNNLTANALLKMLGAHYYQTQGGFQNGLKAMTRLITQETHIDFSRALLTDASGLSRYNLIQPDQVTHLLYYINKNTITKKYLIPNLPRPGTGTMIYRPSALKHRLQAKTGSMSGISSLAGYLKTKHHGVVSFSIIINGFVGSQKPFRQFEDDLCKWIINA